MSQQPPDNGELGTNSLPTTISTDVLELLTTGADSLVGLARDTAEQQDGTVVYASDSGVPTDLAVWVDGTKRPVTGVEWVDSGGTHRPVTEWHLGPLGEFELTLDSLTFVQPATFNVSVSSTTSPVQPGGTLETADVTNTGDESGTQTVTLDINNSVGQVDSANVTLSGGGSVTKTLSWSVPSGQTEQDYTATVASADDSASQTVTVPSASVPSSAIHRWKLDDVGSGAVADDFNVEDGAVNGTSSVSGTWQGAAAASFDGTDDDIQYNNDFNSVGIQPNDSFAVAVTLQPDQLSSVARYFSAARDGQSTSGSSGTAIFLEHSDANNGDVEMFLIDDEINFGTIRTSSGGHLSTTTPTRVLVQKPAGDDVSGAEVYINGSSVPITVTNNALTGPYKNFTKALYGSSISIADGDQSSYYDGVLDDAIWYNSTLSSSEASDDYNIQPWS